MEQVVPGAGLEPAWHCCRGIFLPAAVFTAARRRAFVVWTFPLPHPEIADDRQGPSSLYTFSGIPAPELSSGLPPPRRAEVSPNLTPFTPAVSALGAQFLQVPCVYQFHHPGMGWCIQQRKLWRLGSELNRRTRLCRPLHDHSATQPLIVTFRSHKAKAPRCLGANTQRQTRLLEKFGAGNETRTRDPNLGKVVLYQLSYSRSFYFSPPK